MKQYYKIISADGKAVNGGSFDYAPYLPGGAHAGEWLPRIEGELKHYERGYHLTEHWNFYWKNTYRIFECEILEADILHEENLVGVEEKIVVPTLRIIKEFFPQFVDSRNTGNWNTGNCNTGNCNTGNWNTGDRNTGDRNTGDRNTGDSNTGDRNTGNWNTGYWNTGDRNTGDCNTGDWNTGDWNTGNWNTGDRNTGYRNTGDRNTGNSNTGNWNTGNWNTGDRNTGYRNTGDRNTGNSNTGNWNTGDWNTGNWNTADKHTGAFNTKPPQYMELFNKKIPTKKYDAIKFPDYFRFELDVAKTYKECFCASFAKASKAEIVATIKLPNFSYKVFAEVSGITKKMIDERLK